MRTMTKETIRASLHSTECLAFVKNRLNSIQQLPDAGFVAGQAVASAVIEFLKMDHILNPIYNDIDVFQYINKGQMTVEQAKRFAGKANATVLNREIVEETGIYGHLTESFYYSDKIIDSIQIGDFINETTVMRMDRTTSGDKFTLRKFDINSTQVGFSIQKDALLFTDDFLLFLVTKELQIVSLATPIHSIIRFHKKHAEFGGAYADFETNELLAYTQATFSIAYRNQKVIPVEQESSYYHPIFFGEKHKNDFFRYGLDEKGHLLYSDDVARRTGNKEDSRTISAILSTLAVPRVVDKFYNYASGLSGYGIDYTHEAFMNAVSGERDIGMANPDYLYSLSKVPADTHKMKRVRRSAFSAFSDVSFRQMQVMQRVHEEDNILDLALNVNVDILKDSLRIGKFIAGHSIGILESFLHSSSAVSPEEKLQILKNIQIVDNESGILVGVLESMSNNYRNEAGFPDFPSFVDIDMVRGFLESRKLALSAPLKERKISFSVGDYVITELVSPLELKKEGSSMKHCVGGYSRSVANGDSIIISISCRDSALSKEDMKLHSFTLELGKNDGRGFEGKIPYQDKLYRKYKKPYSVRQIQSFANKKGVFRLDLIEVFNRIKEAYPTASMPAAGNFCNEEFAKVHLPVVKNDMETTLAYRVMFFISRRMLKVRVVPSCPKEGSRHPKKIKMLNPFRKKPVVDKNRGIDLGEIPF